MRLTFLLPKNVVFIIHPAGQICKTEKNGPFSYIHIDIVGKWVYDRAIKSEQSKRKGEECYDHHPQERFQHVLSNVVLPGKLYGRGAFALFALHRCRAPALRVKPYTVPARPLLLSAGHFCILM